MSITQDAARNAYINQGRKNLIINGDMRIWQRGTSFTAPTSGTFCADRWSLTYVSSAVMNVTKGGATAGGVPFNDNIKVAVTTADTSMAAGEYAAVHYGLEGYDISGLKSGTANAGTVTLSFWTSHTKTGTYCVAFRNGSTRGYAAEYTQAVSGSWEKHEITVPLDTTGTWAKDNTLGLQIMFTLASGSSFNGTLNTWVAGNITSTSNQVNGLDSTSNIFRFGGVQLEVGSEATEFEYRTYAEELALCQRYYQVLKVMGMGAFANGTTIAESGTSLSVTMRASPTITYTGTARFSDVTGSTISSSTTITTMLTRENYIWFRQGGFVGLTSGNAGLFDLIGSSLAVNAEL